MTMATCHCSPLGKNENYWAMRWRFLEEVVDAFNKNGIEIPYQQLDVHLSSNKE